MNLLAENEGLNSAGSQARFEESRIHFVEPVDDVSVLGARSSGRAADYGFTRSTQVAEQNPNSSASLNAKLLRAIERNECSLPFAPTIHSEEPARAA